MHYKILISILLFVNLIKTSETEFINVQSQVPYEKTEKEQKPKDVNFVFTHDFGKDQTQASELQNEGVLPPGTLTFNSSDVSSDYPNLDVASFGQDGDIKELENVLKSNYKSLNPFGKKKKVVGFGSGKGAATWLNGYTKLSDIVKVKALVLHNPYTDATDFIGEATYFNYIPGGKFLVKQICKKILPKYNVGGQQPINSIMGIENKQLPIFIIYTPNLRVSVNHSYILYKTLLENNFTQIFFLEVKKDNNVEINSNRHHYKLNIHAFYKLLNLPHIADFLIQRSMSPVALLNLIEFQPNAWNGKLTNCVYNTKIFDEKILLGQAQPSLNDINQRIEAYQKLQIMKIWCARSIVFAFLMYKCFPSSFAKMKVLITGLLRIV